MKFKFTSAALLLAAGFSAPVFAQNIGEELTGDVKLACEAILCLSTGNRPSECSPSIKRYFDITRKKWSDTIDARRDFLSLCPASGENDLMRDLVSALAEGSGRCDAAGLNQMNRVYSGGGDAGDSSSYIQNTVPSICTRLYNHQITDLKTYQPKYVGTPERGGFFVEADKYEEALKAYQKRIEAEDRQRMYDNSGGA